MTAIPVPRLIDAEGLGDLFRALRAEGYSVIGPAVADGAIVLRELSSVSELPYGWGVRLEPGGYQLRHRDDSAAFGHAAGPQSWKRFLHPPREELWSATRTADGFDLDRADDEEPPRYAFLGVRPCDLRAIAIQDRVLAQPGSRYAARRARLFIVAVNCTEPGETCFCASMGAGPGADGSGSAGFSVWGDPSPQAPLGRDDPFSVWGDPSPQAPLGRDDPFDPPGTPRYDLALTELLDSSGRGPASFLVHVGSPRGAEVLVQVRSERADDVTVRRARSAVEAAAGQMGRQMETGDLRDLMAGSHHAARWDDVASQCLTCGNCTMACPTCFCTTIEDTTDLTGEHAQRWERWDSCFDLDFSYLHGGSIRSSAKSRYRQWLTHKLGTWHDQFGSSGCVGCGRCIVWCPVGIDITEEVAALRAERDAGEKT